MPRTDASILIVDDMKTVLSVEMGLLESFGFHPDGAESGGQAVKLLREKKYALALIDYYMPDMRGPEVIRQFRETSPDDGPVFIAVTSDVPQVALSCVREGFSDVMAKPVDKRALMEIIRKYIPTS